MCRSIKPLFNFEPPATDKEIHEASLQFVRKVSGFREPSAINEEAFNQAVKEISTATQKLLTNLTTNAEPKDREIEAARARARAQKRYGNN